jgi:hypothetical protein
VTKTVTTERVPTSRCMKIDRCPKLAAIYRQQVFRRCYRAAAADD